MNKKLFILMGAPGSGKSTWTKRQLNEYTDMYVSRDEIRFRKLQPGDDYFQHEGKVFQEFIDTIVKGLKEDTHTERVFADASHLNPASRGKLIRGIKAQMDLSNVEVNVIWLKTTLKTCIERNNNREGRANVPENTIRDMWNSQKMPTAQEGIDKCYIVSEISGYIEMVQLNSTDENNFKF